MKLTLENVNKSFGTNHVLNDISFSAKSGAAFGLLGRNGSGKTTTIRLIMDILPRDSGSILIDGKAVGKSGLKIGYLPEERGLYPKRKISEQMIYFGELKGMKPAQARENAKNTLERLQAGQYFDKKLNTLSKGNQQKVQLAIAVLNDPDVVILDEPFSGLDPVNAILLKRMVTDLVKAGKLVLFSSHEMNQVEEFCDDICIINKSNIALLGNLRQIKRGYPRDRVFVAGGRSPEEMKRAFEAMAFCRSCEIKDGGVVAALRSPQDKETLLHSDFVRSMDLDSFRVVEPSLEQIFIEKAGDELEQIS